MIKWATCTTPIYEIIESQLTFDFEYKKDNRDGMDCKKCKQFFQYAVPNQPDRITMICWSCRNF